MDAVVLGGAGVMGSYVVEHLAESTAVTRVVAADADPERAAERLPDHDAIETRAVDVTDHEGLVDCLAGFDVAVNCVGPFYEFAPGIVRATIDAGVDLVDICDDYDVTEALLDDFDDEASDAGVTVVVGCGASPGMTNVLARRGADRLDAVEEIAIRVTRGAGAEAGAAIPYHVFHSWLGPVPTHEDGERGRANALQDGEEVVTFPDPFGQVTTYHFGHPETVTLPRVLDAGTVTTKGNLLPGLVRETLLDFQSLGLLDEEPLDVQGTEIRPLDFAAAHLERLGDMLAAAGGDDVPAGGAIVVEVRGTADGRERTHRYEGTARMREATGAAASVGAQLVADGQIDAPGVNPPAACVPPEPFVERLLAEPDFALWESTRAKRTGTDER
jgi:saccharopine dehydrogenase (NAD+, L-lysine-forming)